MVPEVRRVLQGQLDLPVRLRLSVQLGLSLPLLQLLL
jgi:hypothetical protein